jgi:hypothetical protein
VPRKAIHLALVVYAAAPRLIVLVLDSVTSTLQCIRRPRPREKKKRLFRGPSTNDTKKQDGPSRSWPTPHTPPSSSPPKTPYRSYSAQTRSQNEEKNHTPQTVPAPAEKN